MEPMWNQHLTVDEFAAEMRLSRTTIYQLIRNGTLRTVASDTGRMLIPTSELAKYLPEEAR
jgi:excisionase family DNA binding protein